MKLNKVTKVVGDKIILVPYRVEHVKKYHDWMESEQLRLLTASERLTLPEEYAMQQSWLNDENKCTFIVLDKQTMERTGSEVESMIGDANLYLKNLDGLLVGEIGLMIAEEKFRGLGMGKEAALSALRYAVERINVKKFEAFISADNSISIAMFQNIGFLKESESKVFGEIKFTREVDEDFITWILNKTKKYYETVTTMNI